MAPIKTAVILPDRSQIDLIIPVNSEATFDTLQALAVERAARHHSKDLSRITSTLLRLGSQAGPFLYEDDRVQEVISPGDIVFVILTDPSTTTFASQNAQTKPPAATSYSANDFKLRVITPHLAHCHEDIRTIPVLDNGKVFSALSTLRDLRRAIANSLDITLEGEGTPPQVCNCKLAEMSSVMPHLSAGGDLKILVVSGSSNTRWMDVPEPTQGSIMTGLKQLFGETFENANCIHLKGGAETDNGLFTRLPVVSICAKSRHSTIDQVTPVPSPVSTVLDLHTAEGPIHTGCLDASAEELGLTELIVNGVLSLYAVERRTHSTAQEKTIGKDAIFSAARYWDLPRMTVSARGSSAFLSALRVFSAKVGAKEMDHRCQNNVLKSIHQITRYLPAVRAVRILMDGKTPRPNECAAIVQTVAEALRDLVPKPLIENDERRYLEGTRLLLGFVLHKVEALSKKVKDSPQGITEDVLPYLDLFKTVDVRDVRTNESIINPVHTDLGLMERGCFDAFKPGGLLSYDGVEDINIVSTRSEPAEFRAALLNGGLTPEVSYYEADALQAALPSGPLGGELTKEMREFAKDLPYLGMLCQKNVMTVVHPTSLKTASAPVLTLDRDGDLSVYVGRAACAAPDRDISVFRPLQGTVEDIDVNIVAQLIEPIVRARELDGTVVFDLFSKSFHSNNAKPTEVLMFCVDCSRSMENASDFQEVHETPPVPPQVEDSLNDLPVLEEEDDPISLGELKDWLTDHESFEDMMAIVKSAYSQNKRAAGEKVLEFTSLLVSRDLKYKEKKLAEMRSWATRSFLYTRAAPWELQVGSLRRLLSGLNIYKDALCDFIIFRAQAWTETEFTWTYGEPIPHTPSANAVTIRLDITAELSIPDDIICPISQAVFEDPVTTADNHTYERRSIERWFQIRRSSPLTGLPLEDLSLRRHQVLHDQAKRWLSGRDILESAPPARKRSRLRDSKPAVELDLNFVTPVGTFSRRVPRTLTLADLYKLAYRGMRGTQKSFSLHLRGSFLEPNDQQLGSRHIASGSDIVANFNPELASSTMPMANDPEDTCLVKVYSPSSAYELFSYWIPRYTSHSMASIVFRYWRFRRSPLQIEDKQVWSGLTHGGDGVRIGRRHDHYDRILDSLDKLSPQRLVPEETLLTASKDESEDAESLKSSSDEGENMHSDITSTRPTAYYRVFKVELSQYHTPEALAREEREKLRCLTRLAVSKQVFGAFINRLIAYNYPTMMGLISIRTSASIAQPPTSIIENFRHAIDKLKAFGDTALWDGLSLAADQLIHLSQKYPGIKKRIICLSDGEDTNSVVSSHDLCRRLVREKIVVDSCSIGMEDNSDLRTLSYLTGGYKFVPNSLEEAVAMCELEPVLSIHERPAVVLPMVAPLLTSGSFHIAASHAVPDMVTRDDFPLRKSHPNLDDQFVRIDSFQRDIRNSTASSVNASPLKKSAMLLRRLHSEIQNIAANPHPSYDVYVSESNMGFWKVVLSGPSESAYATGTFVLYLDMGDDYPQSPPEGRFITRIFHPNINLGGRICHSIFDRNWTIDTTNKQVLDTVFGLLLVPEFTDPINTVVTLNFYWDEVAFRDEVKKHIEKYALKGRKELGKEILGE